MSALELRESASFENTTHKLNSDGKFIVAGQFSKADLRNENGRVYRRSMWENVLKRPQIVDALKKRKMLGELGHPDKIETTPLNVSHIVTNLELKPNGEIYGEAEILDTPSGRVLRTLYEAGVTMGISSRGYLPEGSNLFAEGEDLIVPDDYELITFDFVIDPSSQGAEPTVQESVKEKLNVILTESRDKINSDMVSYIEGLNVVKEDKGVSGKILSESSDKTSDKHIYSKKEVDSSMDKYTDKLEGVIGELKNRYLTAESVINDFVKERKNADKMLKGVTDRYLTAEQAVEGLRDYSLKLEETVDEVVRMYKTSESVISDLRDRCNVSQDVISDLRDRYTLSESVVKELARSYKVAESIVNVLRDRYTLSEAVIKDIAGRYSVAEAALNEMAARVRISEEVIKGLNDRLAAARKSNISMKRKIGNAADSNINENAEKDALIISQLEAKCKEQDDKIAKLTEQLDVQRALTESKKKESKPERVPVPNSYFEDCAAKYGVTISECKRVFKSMGCRKSAFEFHMNEMKRMSRNNYSEFPYMVDGSTASKALTESTRHNEVDRIARLVESAF